MGPYTTVIQRRFDWDRRLRLYVKTKAAEHFNWKSNSCTHFAAGGVEAMTGVYPIREILNSFDSKTEATDVLRNVFKGNLEDAVAGFCREHGFQEIKKNYAQRGDLCILEIEDFNALLICNGAFAVGPSEVGLRCLPIRQAKRTWRIPLMSF